MKYVTKEQLQQAVVNSTSKADVLRKLGFKADRGLYPVLDTIATKYNIPLPNNRRGDSRKIRDISVEELLELSDKLTSKKQLLEHYGFKDTSQNYKVLNEILNSLEITKFNKNPDGLLNKQYKKAENYLTENSQLISSKLRIKLLKEEILKEECAICGIKPIWNQKPLTLQLDHINGVNNDNRLENLRILCPNCHSQTDNYTSKNIK